jgi:hypothetical protein
MGTIVTILTVTGTRYSRMQNQNFRNCSFPAKHWFQWLSLAQFQWLHCEQTLWTGLAPSGVEIWISNIMEAMDSDPDGTVFDLIAELFELLDDLKELK